MFLYSPWNIIVSFTATNPKTKRDIAADQDYDKQVRLALQLERQQIMSQESSSKVIGR